MDKKLTVKESLELLAANGIDWTDVWLRIQIGRGTIPSFKEGNTRWIYRSHIMAVIKKRNDQKVKAAA